MKAKTETTEKTKSLYGQDGIAANAMIEENPFAPEEIVAIMMIGDTMIAKIVMIAVAKIAETEMTDAVGRAEIVMIVEIGRARVLVTDEEAIDHAATVENDEIETVNGSVWPVHCSEI